MNLKDVFDEFKNLKSSKNAAQVIRNSKYEFGTTLVFKIFSLVFTIIMARLLLPELYGLYSLALSTILLFAGFSDLGIGYTQMVFVSKNYDKNPGRAKAFLVYLFRFRLILLLAVSLLLFLFSGIISEIYDKPLSLALVIGAFYVIISGLFGFLETTFRAKNDFKTVFWIKGIIFNVFKVGLTILAVILIKNVSQGFLVGSVVFALTLSYLVAILFYLRNFRKISFLGVLPEKLDVEEKKRVKKSVFLLSVFSLSGSLFGYVDITMLGYFIDSQFIGHYVAALALTTSAAGILGFAGISLLPVFTRLKKQQLERGFKKSLKWVSLVLIAGMIFTLIFAELIINVVYGTEYAQAVPLLYLLSLFLVLYPLTGIYESYLISSQENLKPLSVFYFVSILFNVILNYFLITYFLNFGMFEATIGAGIATIISRIFYLAGLHFIKRKTKTPLVK